MTRFQVEEHIAKLLHHLGLEQAHFAARLDMDWTSLVANRAELVASLTLVCPGNMDASVLRPLDSRLLVFNDDQRSGQGVTQAMASLPDATLVTLPNYFGFPWSDVAADHPEVVATAMMEFLARMDAGQDGERTVTLPEGKGEIDGLSYHIRGSGPPLVLLPLQLAPSQWDPLLPALSERFCTIMLSGAEVGFVAVLEARGRTGYLRVVRNVLEEMTLHPGAKLLEVGCGSGVLSRWLAHHTGKDSTIVAVDVNAYLLREAELLITKEGLGDVIEFREGNAEALPFPSDSFDVTLAFTVLEEGDADRMLAEMVRVTKPGGQVAVIVRGVDKPWLVNLKLPDDLKTKVEAPPGLRSIAQGGCGDVSLYRRVREAGLTDLKLLPQLAPLTGPMGYYYLDRIQATLGIEERNEWHTAMAQAEAEGTLFIAQPFHCAVGTMP